LDEIERVNPHVFKPETPAKTELPLLLSRKVFVFILKISLIRFDVFAVAASRGFERLTN
jgi:hypothetical protein